MKTADLVQLRDVIWRPAPRVRDAMVLLRVLALLAVLSACADDEKKFSSEGTQTAPIVIAASSTTLPRKSTVGETNSFYQISGITSMNAHTVTLTEVDEAINLIVYQVGFFNIMPANTYCSSVATSNTNRTSVSCAGAAMPTGGIIYVLVQPINYSKGSEFQLTVSPIP